MFKQSENGNLLGSHLFHITMWKTIRLFHIRYAISTVPPGVCLHQHTVINMDMHNISTKTLPNSSNNTEKCPRTERVATYSTVLS